MQRYAARQCFLEIVIQVDKNAPGVVGVLFGDRAQSMAEQSVAQASTSPARLSAGSVDISIVFSETSVGARMLLPSAGQLMEHTGNLTYVVLPGSPGNPVVAKLRLTVH